MDVANIQTVFIHPGEVHIASKPVKVITVLGSCISVIMYDTVLKTGAMTHALLPKYSEAHTSSSTKTNPLNYVDRSTVYILKEMEKNGSKRSDIEVKVFGGSGTLGRTVEETVGFVGVGEKNIAASLEILKELGLSVVAQDLGGPLSRKIHFYTETGDVYMKYIKAVYEIDPIPPGII